MVEIPDGSTRDVAYRTCPGCGTHVDGPPYDIGSGPELSCPNCETCFGAEGQNLNPADAYSWIANDPEMRKQVGWDDENGKPNLILGATQCQQCGKTIFAQWHYETGKTDAVEHCDDHQ